MPVTAKRVKAWAEKLPNSPGCPATSHASPTIAATTSGTTIRNSSMPSALPAIPRTAVSNLEGDCGSSSASTSG